MSMYGQRNQNPDFVVGNGPQKCSVVGCTVTSLANLFSVNGYSFTPQQVNDALMKVKVSDQYPTGFSGQLIIWGAIQKAFPFVTGSLRVTSHNEAAETEAVVTYGGCLLEVSAAPIGGSGKHWILKLPNQRAYDPWNNQETPISNWNPSGYAVIQLVKNAPTVPEYRGFDLTNQDSMKVCVDDHIKVAEGQLVDKSQYETIKGQLTEIQKQNDELSSQLGSANGTIKALTAKIESLNTIVGEYQKEDAVQIKDLTDAQTKANAVSDKLFLFTKSARYELKLSTTIDNIDTADNEVLESIHNLYQTNISYEKQIKELETLTKPVSSLTKGELILQLVKKLFGKG